jgi:hypothetical protein
MMTQSWAKFAPLNTMSVLKALFHIPIVSVLRSLALSTISITPCFTKGVLPDFTMRTGSCVSQRGAEGG